MFLFDFSASSMEEGDVDGSGEETSNTKSLRKIGVEIETSAIKIKSAGGYNIGFIFKSDEKEWKLEDDTRDTPEESDVDLYNLEMKTEGGYVFNEFISILELMTNLLNEIYYMPSESEQESKILSLEKLNEIISKLGQNYSISKLISSQKDLEFITRDHTKVRPQITYEVSLNEIPRIFSRMADLGHEPVVNFLKPFRDDFEDFEIIEKYAEREKFKKLILLNFFNKTFSQKIKESHLSRKVVGFSYLFLFYWENLFHNGTRKISEEPGPKSSLTIMSRIPFSEMYDYGLNEEEKEQFKYLFDNVITAQGHNYILIKYKTETNMEPDEVTLLQWYNSIINEDIDNNEGNNKDRSKRKNTKKNKKTISARKRVDGRFVDLLSPPSQLGRRYAMGVYYIKKDNPLALLEVRGYPRVFDATIEDVYTKVSKESRWFFGND